MTADTTRIAMRRAREDDVPRIVELIASAHLPPLFVPEYLSGFVVAEQDGEVVACGGLEMFGACGVIRSVVVDERLRGSGLGKRLWQLLEADARKARATDLYLFTGDAHDFWLRLGFADKALDEWKPEVRINWQYQFVSQNSDLFGDDPPLSMWRAA